MTERAVEDLREKANPGAGDEPPAGADGSGGAGADPGSGGEKGEKVPWHDDPRFKQFQKDREELKRDREELQRTLQAARAREVTTQERSEIEQEVGKFPIPEEMAMPSDQEFAEADFTDAQTKLVRRLIDASVHNDRRKMLMGYAAARKKQAEERVRSNQERRRVIARAEQDFGNREFGSLADPKSPLRTRFELILRTDPAIANEGPLGIYRAARQGYDELLAAKVDPGARPKGGGEELLGGRQPGGAQPGGGARPGFKQVPLERYLKMTPKEREAYDRAELGLPPEE